MTVANTPRTAGPYPGTGSTSVFAFSFKVFLTTDVLVQFVSAGGLLSIGTLGTDYAVSLNADQNGNPGGSVITTVPLPSGATLTIGSQVPLNQGVVLTNPGGFYPQVISDALDKITILIQQSLQSIAGAIRIPEIGSSAQILPIAAQRANKLLSFDASGNPVTIAPNSQDATSVSIALSNYIASLASTLGATLIGFLQSGTGAGLRTVQARLRDVVSANDFGAIGDGTSHPLSSITTYNGVSTVGWNLAQWQVVFPHAVALTDEMDWCAWQAAVNALNPYVFNATFNNNQGGGTVRGKRGVYLMSRTLRLAAHVMLRGDGAQTFMGQSSPTGPADGLIFMPVAAGFVGVAVIDSTGYVIATGLRYASATPLTATSFTGGLVSYTEGCGLRDLAVKANGTTGLIGIRMQGSPGCKVLNVSAQGFAVNSQGICCWNSEWDVFNPGGVQISGYFQECHAARVSGEFDNVVVGGVGNGVTVGNKPACWSAIDTIYVSTSLYLVNNLGLEIPSACSQHTGGSYAENSHVTFGTWYNEDHGLSNPQSGAYVTGAAFLRANNGSVSTTPSVTPATTPNIVINNLMSTANGSTAFDSVYNANILLHALSQPSGGAGVGIMYGSHTSTGQQLYVGPGVVRNANFPDLAYDSRIINLAPTPTGTWTPGTTNVGGSIASVVGEYIKRGNVYDCTITITGTGLTATGGGATILTTPFNGTGGFPAPSRASAGAVATANLQAVGCALMDTNANFYLPAVASTTRIVASFSLWAV